MQRISRKIPIPRRLPAVSAMAADRIGARYRFDEFALWRQERDCHEIGNALCR
jgi:hypothetical protein